MARRLERAGARAIVNREIAMAMHTEEPIHLSLDIASGGPVVLNGVSWEHYEGLIALLGDGQPGLRRDVLRGR